MGCLTCSGTDRSVPQAHEKRLGTVLIFPQLFLMLLHNTSLVEEGTVPSWSSVCMWKDQEMGTGQGL